MLAILGKFTFSHIKEKGVKDSQNHNGSLKQQN